MRKHPSAIYRSRLHLAVTFFFVVLPFIFFLIFSQFADVPAPVLFRDIGVSTFRLAAAYVISVVLAWVWAVSFYRGRRSDIALPMFDVLQSFPTFAILPLGTMMLGANSATVIFFLVVTIVWPIFFSIVSSLKLIKRDWEEAVVISRLSGINYIRMFLLPVSIPGLIMGSIIGLGEGWEALVATELIVRPAGGLGSFFGTYALNPSITIFGVFGLLILIFSFNKLVWFPLLDWSHRKMGE